MFHRKVLENVELGRCAGVNNSCSEESLPKFEFHSDDVSRGLRCVSSCAIKG
jgi:hypothetical protein